MDPLTRQLIAATGGSSGLSVDEVYDSSYGFGTSASLSVVNGIDNAGAGGLVWIKSGNQFYSHYLFDTERGVLKRVSSDSANPENTIISSLTAFNSDGYDLGNVNEVNGSIYTYFRMNFRRAPKFFDIVTYTGTGSAQTISHNLDAVPGMIIVKNHTSSISWAVYHDVLGPTKYLPLNTSNQAVTSTSFWNDTAPTSTEFTVGTSFLTNQSTQGHVAYLFANDEEHIKCGSYIGNGSSGSNGPVVNLGFQPQFVLLRRPGGSGSNWYMFDTSLGINSPGTDNALLADTTNTLSSGSIIDLTATGFQITSTGTAFNQTGIEYLYMAVAAP